jgi:hypothetical protein
VTDRLSLQREALRTALQLRRSLSIPRHDPINVYDVAEALGVEIQFVDLPSLEGMFYRGPDPKIILPCLRHRPRGRVTFTCGHELGHFELGHGTRVDEYVENARAQGIQPDDELAANTFAASLLMPRPAVLERFRCRDWDLESASPLQLFTVAGELDVGYFTLVRHVCYGLEIVDRDWLADRERTAPKALRALITGEPNSKRVVICDQHWPAVPIDLEVGDYLAVAEASDVAPPDWAHNRGINKGWRLFVMHRPGIYAIILGQTNRLVRVARSGYCGLLRYRFWEEVEDQ